MDEGQVAPPEQQEQSLTEEGLAGCLISMMSNAFKFLSPQTRLFPAYTLPLLTLSTGS